MQSGDAVSSMRDFSCEVSNCCVFDAKRPRLRLVRNSNDSGNDTDNHRNVEKWKCGTGQTRKKETRAEQNRSEQNTRSLLRNRNKQVWPSLAWLLAKLTT